MYPHMPRIGYSSHTPAEGSWQLSTGGSLSRSSEKRCLSSLVKGGPTQHCHKGGHGISSLGLNAGGQGDFKGKEPLSWALRYE